jgi:hypothetical protein
MPAAGPLVFAFAVVCWLEHCLSEEGARVEVEETAREPSTEPNYQNCSQTASWMAQQPGSERIHFWTTVARIWRTDAQQAVALARRQVGHKL